MTVRCSKGHPQSWADKKFGCYECGERNTQLMKRRISRRSDGPDYHPELARFPGDPEARTSSKRDLDKLIDKRKREGWQLQSLSNVDKSKKELELPSLGESWKRVTGEG